MNWLFFHNRAQPEEEEAAAVDNKKTSGKEEASTISTATSSAPPNNNLRRRRPSDYRTTPAGSVIRPLSMHVIKSLAGMGSRSCCIECSPTAINNNNNTRAAITTDESSDDDDCSYGTTTTTHLLRKYDLQELARQNSSASPLVLAPMMASAAAATMNDTTVPTTASSNNINNDINNNDNCPTTTETILTEYMAACRFYGCGDRINAGVLTTIRFSLPCLRVSHTNTAAFYDADMLALAEILLRHANGPLSYITRLDFSLASSSKAAATRGFGSHGALALAKVLQTTQHIQQVHVSRHRIGSYGACALFLACSHNATVEKLFLRRCQVGERGALFFAELFATCSTTGLTLVDLSANHIGWKAVQAVEDALIQRSTTANNGPKPAGTGTTTNTTTNTTASATLPHINVDLEGNLVLQEIMNGITHGLGMLLAFCGAHLLSKRVADSNSWQHILSCGVYSASLLALYTSSTLYHSFFSLRNTRWIFEVCDKSAIYILISGSYTPFLRIVLWQEDPEFSNYLLAFQWICCVIGIYVEAAFPIWKYRTQFSLAMYLAMGWSVVVCLPAVARVLPPPAMKLLVLGGVVYTVGVPFFVRNHNLDHSIWHVFVLAGSIFHWCAIYFYVSQVPIIP